MAMKNHLRLQVFSDKIYSFNIIMDIKFHVLRDLVFIETMLCSSVYAMACVGCTLFGSA